MSARVQADFLGSLWAREKALRMHILSRRRKDILVAESPVGRVMSWVAPVGSGLVAPQLPRGGALQGAPHPPAELPPRDPEPPGRTNSSMFGQLAPNPGQPRGGSVSHAGPDHSGTG